MRYKILGERTGLKVAEFALGTGMLGMQYGYGTEPEEARRIVSGYIDAGGNLFDLSDAYQGGESEKLIGDFIATNRNDYVIATKYSRSSQSKPSLGVLGNSRKVMIQAVEDSLRRLKTDHIDIYFAHLDDGATPVEEIARGFDDLARAGKILYAGLSNFPAWRVATAAKTADLRSWVPISAIEVEYSLLQRTTEREILPMADAFGLGVLGYSTLAGGILTAKYRKGEKGRATGLKASVPYSDADNGAVLDVLIAVSEELATEPGKVAVAWVSMKGIIPILGAKTRAQLESNLTTSTVRLSSDQMRRLDEASAISPSYPHQLLASESVRNAVTGNRAHLIDYPPRTVA